VILELRNNLHEGAKADCYSNNDAPVVILDDRSSASARSALAFLESFDLLANNECDSSRIGVQDVTRTYHSLGSTAIFPSPFEVGFVSSGDRVSSGSNSHGNWKVTFLGLQNQATSSFDVDNGTDADLNPAKGIIDGNQILSHFYAGLEKKDKNNPGNKKVQRQRAQEGSKTVDVKVESSNQEINQKDYGSANQSSHGSVLESLHDPSLTEEEVG
jgi:hypothetical protein